MVWYLQNLTCLLYIQAQMSLSKWIYDSGVREKSRLETIEDSSFFLLCLSMSCCLDQLRTLIYSCEMEEGHGELGSRKYRAPNRNDYFSARYSVPGSYQSLVRCPVESSALLQILSLKRGSLTPLSSPWNLHLTVTILPFPYTNNFVLTTQFSKLNQYIIWDMYTGIKTSKVKGNN